MPPAPTVPAPAPASVPSPSSFAAPRHPRGLYTLYFTEMWERLSYYGMRALLVLFMVDAVRHGGMGLTDKTAAAIYGLYTAGVYLAALPGGWLADRLFGAQRAVWLGGIVIALGHFSLAIPGTTFFFLGLLLVVLGTGLLKPNVSTLVGELYPEGGARRDAGFTLFYMGINLGAALGPLVCSTLGEKVNWHWGFAAAGIGMVCGLIQFRLTRHHLGPIGGLPTPTPTTSRDRQLAFGGLGVLAVAAVLLLSGVVSVDPIKLARQTTVVIVGLAVAWFAWAFLLGGLTRDEKRRLGVIAILFVASAMFWSGFEQAGSSLNLFAERHTQRVLAGGFEVPAGWFQSLNAGFVILFAPVVATLWITLARRGTQPPLIAKFATGLLLLAAGFLVLVVASRHALASGPVWPTWLILTYLLHTWGELLLSPVGLSSVTRLAPRRLVGQAMGIWFLGTSLGNLLAGLFAGTIGGDAAATMPARFFQVVLTAGGTGLLLLLATPLFRRLTSDAK